MSEGASPTGQATRFLPGSDGDRRGASAEDAIMRVEILYLAGCPNHPPAVGRVLEVLQAEGVSAELVEVEVKDAATAGETGFPGSPTIRIDGRDVEPGARPAQAFG